MSFDYSDQHGFDPSELSFDAKDVVSHLESLSLTEIGLLRFGVIGVNEDCLTTRYNLRESEPIGRPMRQTVGQPVDQALAPILNGEQIANHLAKMIAADEKSDETFTCDLLDRVGVKVRLRMVCDPSVRTRYLLIDRT